MATKPNAASSPATAPRGAKRKATIPEQQHTDFSEVFAKLGLPTPRRAMVAFVANLLVAGTTMYFGANLTVYLALGAAVLTGSAFLVFMISFIGYVLAILGGIMLGGRVQTFILDGSIDRSFAQARSYLSDKAASAQLWIAERKAAFV